MQQRSPLGRLIVLILVVGLAIGAWRYWQGHKGLAPPGGGGGLFGGGLFGGGNGASNGGSSGAAEIEFLTTATKSGWVQTEIDRFNAQNQGQYHVTLKLIESRDAMHKILVGQDQPAIWSPSSPVWIARLIEVWAQGHNGQQIAAFDDPEDYRVYFKSPLVLLTTRRKAPFLRQALGGQACWDQVRALSLGRRKTSWGTFRYSHADPLNANSGMLTMSLIVTEYGRQTGQSDTLEQAVTSAGFAAYLGQVEKAMLNDAPTQQGSTALETAYIQDPSSRDFITTYESKALEAVETNPELAVVYPNPTSVADQSAAVLSAAWVSPQQHDGAQAFLKFLGTPLAMQDGLHYHFRPVTAQGSLTLANQLSGLGAHGFQQSYNAIELPPYGALNEAANQWRIHVAHQSAR